MHVTELPYLSGGVPFLGHVPEMRNNRLGFVHRLNHEVDRIGRLRTLGTQAVVVHHPEVLQELMLEKARIFEKSAMTRFSLYPLAGEGLFTSNGDLWRRQRKLMAPMFHPGQLRNYAADMVEQTEHWIRDWKHGERVELAKETTRITMSIAGKTLFGAHTFTEADAIGEALTVALEWTGHNAPSLLAIAHLVGRRTLTRLAEEWNIPGASELAERLHGPVVLPGAEGKELREAMHVLNEQVNRMIQARRSNPGTHADLLAKLLQARDEDDGGTMSDKQVRDEVLTLFVAGHETTASGLAWTIHCLCNHPDIYAQVQAEVDALSGDPTIDDLPKLQRCARVFKEALRLYPPVYIFGRQSNAASSLDGVSMPRDMVVLVVPYGVHRRADLFPNPERFDPERFLPEAEAKRHKLAWLPFGAGPRVCIGNHFAMMEAQLVLAKILRHARFEAIGVEEPDAGATLRPKNGMPMRVFLRAQERGAAQA
jgi:cytochrome P450